MKSHINAALSTGWRVALWSLIGAVGWAAETGEIRSNSAKNATNAQRFLFVVETSADNRKYEEANRQAVFDLIVGGVNSQMRTGDSFGIWTFSDEVRTGEFPVTLWDGELALEIGTQVAAFLEKQRYSKNPDIKSVMVQLRLLTSRVPDVNVFIVSTGREKIEGTPYDQKINAAYEVYAKRPGKLARQPLVTSFVVNNGRPTRPAVGLAGEPILLPPRPLTAARPTTKTNDVKGPNSPSAALAAKLPNSGGRTGETAIALSSTSAVAEAAAPRTKVFQFVTLTNGPGGTKTTGAVTTITVPASNPTEGNAAADPATAVRPPAPASATITRSPIPANPSTNIPVLTSLETPARALVASASTGTPPSPAPAASALPAPAPAPASASQAPNEMGPPLPPPPALQPKPEYSVTPVSTILSAAAQAMTPVPLPVAAREPVAATPSDPNPDPADAAPASAPVASVTIPALQKNQLPAGALIAIGGTLLGATCFLLILVLRRTPQPTRGSLISQSMDRH